MFAFSAGFVPAKGCRAICAHAAVAALLATLGGCATEQSAAQYAGANTRVAQYVVEVERDGLPAQTPPSARIRKEPDDPSEPYSRNYGGVNPSANLAPLKEAEADDRPAPKLPADLPPDFRKKLVTALNLSQ